MSVMQFYINFDFKITLRGWLSAFIYISSEQNAMIGKKSFQTNVYRMSKFDTYIFNNLYINDYKMFWIDSGIAKLIDKNCLVSYEINSSSIILLKN